MDISNDFLTMDKNDAVEALFQRLNALLAPENAEEYRRSARGSGDPAKHGELERLLKDGLELMKSLELPTEFPLNARELETFNPPLESCCDFLQYYLGLGLTGAPAFFDWWERGFARRICGSALSALDEFDVTKTVPRYVLRHVAGGYAHELNDKELYIAGDSVLSHFDKLPGPKWILGGETVSELHAIVVKQQGDYLLMDRFSKNGTFVNGERLKPGTLRKLKPGDRILLGSEELVFSQTYRFLKGSKPLKHDLQLDFQSIHAMHGHYGSSVRYVHETHSVVFESWGTDVERKTRTEKLPDDVVSREQIKAYIGLTSRR